VSSLRRIARGLGTTPAALLDAGPGRVPGIRTVRKDERVRVGLHDAHMTVEVIPGLLGGALESWIAELTPEGSPSGSLQTHAGEEFVYVLDGTVELLVDGDVRVLNRGEAAHVRGTTPHRIRAGAAVSARVLTVQTASPIRG
jgi:glyoxylate utilization-related uncharacterized protein